MRAPLLLHARRQSLVLKSWCSPAGYVELWAVGAVGAAHLVSAGSCAVRHHTWGSLSPDFAAFLLLQLWCEFAVSAIANGDLLAEGVRVDRAQRALRPLDHAADCCLGAFATAMACFEGDRCAALLHAVCGAFHGRISSGDSALGAGWIVLIVLGSCGACLAYVAWVLHSMRNCFGSAFGSLGKGIRIAGG